MVLASDSDGKVQIVVAVTPDLTGRIKAGQIVKELAPIVGGGGGGRPDFAEAGGKQPEKIDEMLNASEAVVCETARNVQVTQASRRQPYCRTAGASTPIRILPSCSSTRLDGFN